MIYLRSYTLCTSLIGLSYLKNSVVDGINIFSSDNTISNNFITEAETDGIFAFGTDSAVPTITANRNIIKDNTIVNSNVYGIFLESGVNTVDDNQVLDNTIISSGKDGIRVFAGKRVVIQGNTINQSGQFGIEVDSFSNLDPDFFQISEDVIIKGNSITNSGEFGIEIESDSLNTVITDNTFAGNGDGDNLLNNGTDTVLAGNVPNLM